MQVSWVITILIPVIVTMTFYNLVTSSLFNDKGGGRSGMPKDGSDSSEEVATPPPLTVTPPCESVQDWACFAAFTLCYLPCQINGINCDDLSCDKVINDCCHLGHCTETDDSCESRCQGPCRDSVSEIFCDAPPTLPKCSNGIDPVCPPFLCNGSDANGSGPNCGLDDKLLCNSATGEVSCEKGNRVWCPLGSGEPGCDLSVEGQIHCDEGFPQCIVGYPIFDPDHYNGKPIQLHCDRSVMVCPNGTSVPGCVDGFPFCGFYEYLIKCASGLVAGCTGTDQFAMTCGIDGTPRCWNGGHAICLQPPNCENVCGAPSNFWCTDPKLTPTCSTPDQTILCSDDPGARICSDDSKIAQCALVPTCPVANDPPFCDDPVLNTPICLSGSQPPTCPVAAEPAVCADSTTARCEEGPICTPGQPGQTATCASPDKTAVCTSNSFPMCDGVSNVASCENGVAVCYPTPLPCNPIRCNQGGTHLWCPNFGQPECWAQYPGDWGFPTCDAGQILYDETINDFRGFQPGLCVVDNQSPTCIPQSPVCDDGTDVFCLGSEATPFCYGGEIFCGEGSPVCAGFGIPSCVEGATVLCGDGMEGGSGYCSCVANS